MSDVLPHKVNIMHRDRLQQYAVIVAIITTIAINGLANSLPFGGRTTGEISDLYPTRLTPAAYAFSIWSLIYIGLLAFGIYQFAAARRGDKRLRAIRPYVVINCAANCLWLWLWHNNQIMLSSGVIIVMLATLIVIYTRLQTGASQSFLIERLCVEMPFSLYFGWITVATIVNIAVALVAAGWDGAGLGAETWAALLIGIALAVAAAIYYAFREPVYVLVFAWAFIAIAVAQADAPAVRWAALAGAGTALLLVLFGKWKKRNMPQAAMG